MHRNNLEIVRSGMNDQVPAVMTTKPTPLGGERECHSPACLLTVPVEILDSILIYIPEASNLKALCLTNKALSHFATQRLYRRVAISTDTKNPWEKTHLTPDMIRAVPLLTTAQKNKLRGTQSSAGIDPMSWLKRVFGKPLVAEEHAIPAQASFVQQLAVFRNADPLNAYYNRILCNVTSLNRVEAIHIDTLSE